MEIAFNFLIGVAALVAILDYFGIKPKWKADGPKMSLSRRWKLAIMLALVGVSLGFSIHNFYRFRHPVIVERPMPCPEVTKPQVNGVSDAGPNSGGKSAAPATKKPPKRTNKSTSDKGGQEVAITDSNVSQTSSGNCSPNQIGNTNVNNCWPPDLKLSWKVTEKPSQNASHPYYRQVTITPNVEWHPVRIKVECDREIKDISPFGFLTLPDAYVSPNNPNIGYVTAENPPVAAGQSFVFGVWSDEPITVKSVEPSQVPRRRNILEGPG